MAMLRALAILAVLLVLLVVLAKTGQTPVPVNVQWGELYLGTTAPVAITLGLLVVLAAFYVGQLSSWLWRLPSMLADLAQGRQRQTTLQTLTDAYTHLALGNSTAAAKLAKKINPTKAEQPLFLLLRAQLNQLSGAEEQQALAHPVLGPLVALQAARRAAVVGDWPLVRQYTAAGRAEGNQTPALAILHFKALVNLNDPSLTTFLPEIKPYLSKQNYQLVSTLTAVGISTPHAAALSQPWVKQFQAWLPTASETFPEEPKLESKATKR